MHRQGVIKVVAIITGLLIAGEALALLIGMRAVGPVENPWLTPVNNTLLVLDLATGAGLVAFALLAQDLRSSALFFGLAVVAILTHSYRVWEVMAANPNPFCANLSMVIMNAIKLIGAAGTLLLRLA